MNHKLGDKMKQICDGCGKGELEYVFNGIAFKLTKGVFIFCKYCGIGVARCSYGCNKEERENGYDCGLDDSGVY